MAMKRPGIYAPLSAYYFDDAAIMEAGEDAELLYVRMLAYAARQMEFEGFISDRVITSRLGITARESGNGTGNVPGTDAGSRAGILAEYGLLTREEGGYRITGWLKWNKSAAELGKERARDRQRKNTPDKGVSQQGRETVRENVRETVREPMRESGDNDQTRPDQTRPEGARSESSGQVALAVASPDGAALKTKRGSRLPDGWTPARSEANLTVEGDRAPEWLTDQLERFCDYWHGISGAKGVKADWDATWRNWIKRAADYAPKGTRPRTFGQMTDDDWAADIAAAKARIA